MKRSVQAKLLVLIVFSIGVATGVVLTNLYESRVQGGSEDRRARFARERDAFYDFLSLSTDQRAQLTKVLEETRGEYRQLRERTRPAFEEIRQQSRDRIRAILNEEQMRRYDEWVQSQRERHKRRND